MPPTILLFGNCQAGSIRDAFLRIPDITRAYAVAHLRNFGDAPWRQLRSFDAADAIILLEQIDFTLPTPGWLLEELRPGLPRLTFVAMDTNLLWPLRAHDPRNTPEPDWPFGRYPYGDRLVVDLVRRGLTGQAAVDAYFAESPALLPDLTRLAVMERRRLDAREADAHIKIADLIDGHYHEKHLFWTTTHPGGWLFRQMAGRLFDVLRGLLRLDCPPEQVQRHLAGFDPLSGVQLPIHPIVAERLGLDWAGPDRLWHMHGHDVTFAQYVRRMIDWAD